MAFDRENAEYRRKSLKCRGQRRYSLKSSGGCREFLGARSANGCADFRMIVEIHSCGCELFYSRWLRWSRFRYQHSRDSVECRLTIAARQWRAHLLHATRPAESRQRPAIEQSARRSTNRRNIHPVARSTRILSKTCSRPAIARSMKPHIAKNAIPSVDL